MRPTAGSALVAAAAFVLLEGRPIAAASTIADIGTDSDLVLHEQIEMGTYHDYTVHIRIRGRSATLVAHKDRATTSMRVPLRPVLELWKGLQGHGLERLADATPDRLLPDQSSFRVDYRIRNQSGGFSAYAVDSLADTRYRSVVRDILALADAQVKRAARPKSH